jgi:hypothetical protein
VRRQEQVDNQLVKRMNEHDGLKGKKTKNIEVKLDQDPRDQKFYKYYGIGFAHKLENLYFEGRGL